MSDLPASAAARLGVSDSLASRDPVAAESGAEEDGLASLVSTHLASMPRKYRQLFDPTAIRMHAAIAQRRGTHKAHAEMWRVFPPGGVAICVVGEDGPGLLARIGAALVAHKLDVVAAQVYTRQRADGEVEAVDFFWVRHLEGVIPDEAEIAAFAETLDGLVTGRAGLAQLRRIAPVPPGTRTQTRLGFESHAVDGTMVLTVQGTDRPGLLFLISTALFIEGVRITHSDVATFDGQVLDRFHLTEMDGSPLRRSRLLGIQNATLAAIDDRT
jgi:UTP:GlnB (protein PII) uridylyltransferase